MTFNFSHFTIKPKRMRRATNQADIVQFFTKSADESPLDLCILPKPMKEESGIDFTIYDGANSGSASNTTSTYECSYTISSIGSELESVDSSSSLTRSHSSTSVFSDKSCSTQMPVVSPRDTQSPQSPPLDSIISENLTAVPDDANSEFPIFRNCVCEFLLNTYLSFDVFVLLLFAQQHKHHI